MFRLSAGKWVVALGDIHCPHENPLDEVFASIQGCDDLVLLGDFLNLEFASHWNEPFFSIIGEWKHRKNLELELEHGKKVLADIRRAVGKKTRIFYVLGNHEAWLFYACFYHKIYALPFDCDKVGYKTDVEKLKKRALCDLFSRLIDSRKYDIVVLPFESPLMLGPVMYLHGHEFGGKYHARDCQRKFPHHSVVYGHHHTLMGETLYNSGNTRKVYEHISIPALCDLAPAYLKTRSTRWLNGYWSWIQDRGFYSGHVVKVFRGKVIGWGDPILRKRI